MPDCSGYGFGVEITLCVDGPVGDGNEANLTILFSNAAGISAPSTFDFDPIMTTWDGSVLEVDLTDKIDNGFAFANCATKLAKLTIIPDNGPTQGQLLIEITLSDCGAAPNNFSYPQVLENCGNAGPHIISAMSTYNVDQDACE